MFEESIATSRRLIEEAFNEGNLDVIDECCTDDFIGHDPLAGDQDREASKETIAGYRGAFPDIHIEVEDAFASGDRVAVRWTGSGTFENELMGIQPTGERGQPIVGITIDRYEGDRVAESWTGWDTLAFMRNLGAVGEGATRA
jgi:predicted ester cyclase